MSKRVALVGANGKMGKEISGLCDIAYAVSHKKSDDSILLKDLPAKKVDVLIDFSSPEAMSEALAWCVKNKTPFVSGTTGITPAQEKEISQAAKTIPVFWASNFSLGIALVSEMLKVFSGQKNFDYQIEELHHRNKKDSPSGTAKTLQRTLKKIVAKDLPDPVAIRGGEIFGIHKIWAMSSSENITIEHTALNRRVFAEGAVKAAFWLVGKKPGSYTMSELLKG